MIIRSDNPKTIYFTKELKKALGREFLITETPFDIDDNRKFIVVWDGTEWISINKNMILVIIEEEKEGYIKH